MSGFQFQVGDIIFHNSGEKYDEENIKKKNMEKICPVDKILNPNTNRCIRACYVGETRNKRNRCEKNNF